MSERKIALARFHAPYQRLVRDVLEKFSRGKGGYLRLWAHDSADCFVERNEDPFVRLLQISIYEDGGGVFAEITPELYKENSELGMRYVASVVPSSLIRRFYFANAPASKFERELFAAWENTYFITPDMLDKEILLSSK